MFLRAIAFGLVLGFASPLAANAQIVSPNMVFGHYQQFVWQKQHELPQNTVLAVAATRDGYALLSTALRGSVSARTHVAWQPPIETCEPARPRR